MRVGRPPVLCTWIVLAALGVDAGAQQAKEPDAKQSDSKQPADLSAEAKKLDPLAGHSNHGEAFNEGPRQKGYVMGGTGRVQIKVSTKLPVVQKLIDQGVGQLHGFWTFEAERSFRQAAALDPNCAMAYWGMAMAAFNNAKRSKAFIAEAVKRKGKASAREQKWIDGLAKYINGKGDAKTRWKAYLKSFDDILIAYPDELEAKAFLAWAMYTANRKGLPYSSYTALDSVIGQVLEKEPLHPVHHYRIHLWDYKKPQFALRSAALCGPSAPTIAHMWHMPGHIYWRLKRYHDSAWQQEASARADHAQMMRDRVMPYRIGNFAHNNEWLCRSLSHVGRARDATELAKNMIELPRHPKRNRLSSRGSSASYGRSRLLEVLNRYELWEETIRLCDSAYLEPTTDLDRQIKRLRALGQAHFGLGDVAAGRRRVEELEKMKKDIEQKRDAAEAAAEKKARDAKKPARQIAKAKTDVKKTFDRQLRQFTSPLNDLNGRLLTAEGKHAEGLALLNKAGLLKEHLAQFQLAAGQKEKALRTAESMKNTAANQFYPLANYVDVAYRAGQKEKAAAAFKQLRHMHEADLDLPVCRRLAPIARALSLPSDWRLPRKLPNDLGERPDLAKIGPFRWQPRPAPDWTLPASSSGKTISLKDYRGRPVVVIFYLGYGCLHCVEQIDKFAPMTSRFHQAGIELVAVSSDSVADLKKSIDRYEANEDLQLPFPLVADPGLNVFKQFRAHDDFENMPLHGTFLIDAAGLVRWQDVSYDPFMDAEFLLEEAQRLLKQSGAPNKTAAVTGE